MGDQDVKKWLPDKDSNLDKLDQNQLCYRYTIGQPGLPLGEERTGPIPPAPPASQAPLPEIKRTPDPAVARHRAQSSEAAPGQSG